MSIGHEIANPAWLSAECVGLSIDTLALLEKDLTALFDDSPEAQKVWERFGSRIKTLRGHLAHLKLPSHGYTTSVLLCGLKAVTKSR